MTEPKIEEVPEGAMEYAEQVCKSIVETTRKLFSLFFRSDHNVVIIAVRTHADGTKGFIVMSDLQEKQEMVNIMHEAARKAVDGTMIDGDDLKEPRH